MISGLPERLREQRQKIGLSQRMVAERLKVSPSIISGYESGERTPSVDALLGLSHIYHCSIDYLLGKEPDTTGTPVYLDGLSPRQVKLVLGMVDEFQKLSD